METRLTRIFIILSILFSIFGYFIPGPFLLITPYITFLLGFIMFTMGATLSYQDFGRMIRQPTPIAIGVLLQFALMPMIAWLIVRIFHLPDYLAVGIILVACSPGGTASNIICYLSRGDVALSISLTTCSTLLATLLTPMLTFVYIGQTIDVPVFPMIMNIAQVVILPVFAGVCINALMPKQLSHFRNTLSLGAILTVCLIIASAISAVHDEFNRLGPILLLAVILLNLLGYASSYLIASILRFNSKIARTIAIEVAMQNSGLAVVLALQHFNAIASLPGALFSIWHNLSGSIISRYWAAKNKST